MCHVSVVLWFLENLKPCEFDGKRVLEVGSKYVNGSVKPIVLKFSKPREYVGVDIEAGENVDLILPVEKLIEHFGTEAFDVVIATELLEHIKDWKIAVKNMKAVLKTGGIIYISTRSYGFQYHGYPHDYWRFEIEDMTKMFSDFAILKLEKDWEAPGVFLKAQKPNNWKPSSLEHIALYSIAIGKRTNQPDELSLKRKFLLILRKFRLVKSVF
jgi:SAM-dependent methyltransferase